ncbi:MAG: sulfatase/phosphatase domain-containing protein, partial [Chloroflexota bacterium]
YDELYHTPLLYKPAWPSPAKPARVAEPVHLMDVTATALHLMAGEEQRRMGEQELHGASLQPFAKGTARWERQVHYAEYHGDWYGHHSSRMVTDGRWKLVWNLSDLGELYDLDADPHELHNRYYDPSCADVRRRYLGTLLAEAERLGDRQLAHYAPVVAAVEDELAAQMGRSSR